MMVPHEQGERSPVATTGRSRPMLGRARRVEADRAEGARDYLAYHCPACDRALKVRSAYAGRSVVCKHCDRGFVVEVAPPWPVVLPIGGDRAPASNPPEAEADPRAAVIEYLAIEMARSIERNHRLEARVGRLRDELARVSGRRAVAADA